MIDSLHIIQRPIFNENAVSETGLCLRPQVKSLFSWARSMELVSYVLNVYIKTGRWLMPKKSIIVTKL
jgi:hypothetical protein